MQCIYELRRAKREYEQRLAMKINTDCKLFWKFVRQKYENKRHGKTT